MAYYKLKICFDGIGNGGCMSLDSYQTHKISNRSQLKGSLGASISNKVPVLSHQLQ